MATSQDVRNFGIASPDFDTKAGRGRLSDALIVAWNEANPTDTYVRVSAPTDAEKAKAAKAREKARAEREKAARAAAVQTVTVMTVSNGRKVPRNFKATPAEMRAEAVAFGLTVPERGRLSAETTRAWAAAKAVSEGRTLVTAEPAPAETETVESE